MQRLTSFWHDCKLSQTPTHRRHRSTTAHTCSSLQSCGTATLPLSLSLSLPRSLSLSRARSRSLFLQHPRPLSFSLSLSRSLRRSLCLCTPTGIRSSIEMLRPEGGPRATQRVRLAMRTHSACVIWHHAFCSDAISARGCAGSSSSASTRYGMKAGLFNSRGLFLQQSNTMRDHICKHM